MLTAREEIAALTTETEETTELVAMLPNELVTTTGTVMFALLDVVVVLKAPEDCEESDDRLVCEAIPLTVVKEP